MSHSFSTFLALFLLSYYLMCFLFHFKILSILSRQQAKVTLLILHIWELARCVLMQCSAVAFDSRETFENQINAAMFDKYFLAHVLSVDLSRVKPNLKLQFSIRRIYACPNDSFTRIKLNFTRCSTASSSIITVLCYFFCYGMQNMLNAWHI